MAQGNQFLTIPTQEGLFTTIKKERYEEMGEDDEDDNGDEEEEEDTRLIPRSSPIPRKRGHSLTDETAEYMRIRLALPLRRVSFADASGGELVDVRQFVPFDSDDEEDAARWEEEEAKYRRAYRQPTYSVRPDFQSFSAADLLQAVRTNKVEIESVRAVPDEPLSFDVLVRVLNVSFHKSVYVRSTMDGWITYFDYPAEYVLGSNDGETDGFSVRLSFAEPYLFNGARIDFVVRYETDSGEFWANNSGKNYSVTLQVSYEEDTDQDSKVQDVELRGILKPSRYRMDDYYDDSQDNDEGEVAGAEREPAGEGLCAVGLLNVEPEIDIEITEVLSVSSSKTSGDSTPSDHILPSIEVSSDEHPLQDSAAVPPQTENPETTGQAADSLLATKNFVSIEASYSDTYDIVVDKTYTEISVNPNIFPPNQDDAQLKISAQVPFDFQTTSLARCPCIQPVGEDEPEKMKEGRECAQIKLKIIGSEAQMQDQKKDQINVDEELWPCSFSAISVVSASEDERHLSHTIHQDVPFKSLESPSLNECEMHTAIHDTAVRGETSREEAGPSVEPTGEDKVTHTLQSRPATSDPEMSLHHEHESELKELAAVLFMDADTTSISESTDIKEGGTILTSVCKTEQSPDFTKSIKVMSSEDKDRNPCPAEEEPVANEEFEMFHKDPDPFQTQGGLESQPPLPKKTLEVDSAQPEVVLGQTLIPTIAFLCAVVCLVVGSQEPSVFLVLGLFLISLRF